MTDIATVTPLPSVKRKDPTNALRQRRHRAKRKSGPSAPVPALIAEMEQQENSNQNKVDVTVLAQPVKHPARDNAVTFATTTAALALAAVSGGFSISGMTAVFIGAFWPVVCMGAAIELGKLSAVAWLGLGRGSRPLRVALGVLVSVLMALNAIGAYGFLAKAHIGHQVDGDVAIAGRAADIEARSAVQAGVVADLDRQIAQIDRAVEAATAKGRTAGAMQLAVDQRRNRADLAAERVRAGKALAALHVEKASIEGERHKVEADLGPVRYLATLLGAGDQDVLRWFILVVALLLDPAAVLLLAASSARRHA
jgi:hypothetical protein